MIGRYKVFSTHVAFPILPGKGPELERRILTMGRQEDRFAGSGPWSIRVDGQTLTVTVLWQPDAPEYIQWKQEMDGLKKSVEDLIVGEEGVQEWCMTWVFWHDARWRTEGREPREPREPDTW